MPVIKFGLNATNQYTTWPEYLRLCQEAEAMGFDSFWVFDHLVSAPRSPDGPVLECLTTLAALAASTERIRLGSLVLGVTYRNPALVAKMASMIDVISGGRLTLGMGAASAELEHRMYGLPFPPAGERVRRLEEALRLIKHMWLEQPATFSGEFYTAEGAIIEPRPVQQPHPPILVGGWGPRVMKVAARQADIVNTNGLPDVVRERLALVDDECRRVGRDPAAIERSSTLLHTFSDSRDTEREKVRFLEWLWNQPFDRLEARSLTGSPEQVVEQLQSFVDAGVTHFMISMMAPYDYGALRILADKIIPRFR